MDFAGEVTFDNKKDALAFIEKNYPPFITSRCWLTIKNDKGSYSCVMPKGKKRAIAFVQKGA